MLIFGLLRFCMARITVPWASLGLIGNHRFLNLILVVNLYLLCLPSLIVFTLFQGLHGPYPFGQS